MRFVSRIFAPEVGAAAFRLKVLAQAFVRGGAAVEVITTTPPGNPVIDDGDLRVRRWPARRDSQGHLRGYLSYLSFDVPLVGRMLAGGRPDLVVVEPPPTTGAVVRVVSALQRRPYVYYAGDVWSDGAAAMGAPAPVVSGLRLVEGWVLRGALRVLAISDGVAGAVARLGVPQEQILTIGNGIDTDVFYPDGPVVAEPVDFVYAGTVSEWHGAEVFVDALSIVRQQVPGARMVVLGHGSLLDDLLARADRLCGPGAVISQGVVPPAEAAAWLRGAAASLASVRPGIGYDYAKPTKVYASTACGIPVVYAGVGAGQELVRDAGLGWAPGYATADLAEAMLAALRLTAGQRQALAERCVAWTREHASLQALTGRAVEQVVALLDVDLVPTPR